MELFGFNISWNGKNGKYVKPDDCHKAQDNLKDYFDRKLTELSIDRNQKLIELKSDLIEHINIKMEILRK